MSLPDFSQFEPLNELKKKMGIPPDVYGSFPQISPETPPAAAPRPRAYVLLRPSGRRLDLLDPQPDAWTDEDLAVGLSRTYRWSGSSKWDLPLSVAHHSLTVLALREAEGPLTARESMRELLHDATEFMIGWDCLAPLKPQLGPEFARLDRRLQLAVDQRYQLPAWTEDSHTRHKHADRLAAASEAFHVVGWSRAEMRDSLGITLDPIDNDPLMPPPGINNYWEPWPPVLAATLFLKRLNQLLDRAKIDDELAVLAAAFSLLPAKTRHYCNHQPGGNSLTDTLVFVEANDGSQSLEGVVVDGHRDENGDFDLENYFTVFTTGDKPTGELFRCNGANCHVEIL